MINEEQDDVSIKHYQRLNEIFTKCFSTIERAKDKNIILVIGNTGSGKSTVVDYLIGYLLERKQDDMTGDEFLDVEESVIKDLTEDKYAKIGHSKLSETLFPNYYEVNNNGMEKLITLCDCPGLKDNRINVEEERMCSIMNLNIATSTCTSILGVVVVIDMNDLDSGRGEPFANSCDILSEIFKDFKNIAASILFVFNKTTRTPVQVTHKLSNAKKAIEKNVENAIRNVNSSSQVDEDIILNQKRLKILNDMVDHKENIKVVNLLDKGESRRDILTHILTNFKNIQQEEFNFSAVDNNRIRFNELMYSICHHGYKILNEKKIIRTRSKNIQKTFNKL